MTNARRACLALVLLCLETGACGSRPTPQRSEDHRPIGSARAPTSEQDASAGPQASAQDASLPPAAASQDHEASSKDPRFSLKGFSEPSPTALGVVGHGFPAISADAAQIAVTIEQSRSMRDVPNMTLRIHDAASWRILQELELLRFAEGLDVDFSAAGQKGRSALEARVAPRVERANALFAGKGWRSLARAKNDTETPWQSAVQRATFDDLVISYGSHKLTVNESGGRVLLSRAMEWRLPPLPALSAGYGRCFFEPYLHEVYVDRASGAVVLLAGYSITHDACEVKTMRWSLVRIKR